MLKKLIILLIVAAPSFAFSQAKIAHINTQEIFMQMPEISGIESQIAAKKAEVTKALEAIETERNAKYKEFQDAASAPEGQASESVLLDKQKQLQNIQERLETFHQNSMAEIQALQQKLVEPVNQKLQKAIKEVGDEQGYAYILDVNATPYVGSTAVDAGPLVKAKLGIK